MTGPSGFSCEKCGACCRWPGHVLLSDGDIARLAAFLGLSERTFVDRHARLATNRAALSLLEREDGACEFLHGDRCAVYDARPDQCRGFPIRWDVHGDCPGRLGADGASPPGSNAPGPSSD